MLGRKDVMTHGQSKTGVTVGTATAQRGRYVYGTLGSVALPSGGVDTLPVVIAAGDDGPVLWITANIHGNEVTGLAALHEFLTPDLPRRLRGTLVVLPTLNPAGLRTEHRRAYYDDQDPNRLFPQNADARQGDDGAVQTPHTALVAEVAEAMRASADYLIDLHCAWTLSLPFTIRDRVLFRNESERPAAAALNERLDAIVRAFGLPVVNEYPAKTYVKQDLHRSAAGFALNTLHIPAFTAELGATGVVQPEAAAAGRRGIENVLSSLGMLAGSPRPLEGVLRPDPGYPVCREEHPRAPTTGLITYKVRLGDVVRAGEGIAALRDIYARPLGAGVIRTERDGWIVALCAGMVVYPNTYLCEMAVRDSEPLVVHYPQ